MFRKITVFVSKTVVNCSVTTRIFVKKPRVFLLSKEQKAPGIRNIRYTKPIFFWAVIHVHPYSISQDTAPLTSLCVRPWKALNIKNISEAPLR